MDSDDEKVVHTRHHPFVMTPQSGTTNDSSIVKAGTTSVYENVDFKDQHDPYSYDVLSIIDPTRKLQDTDDATLENFFSRPIKIATQSWSTGVTMNADFDPWALYFTNPRVANRLANYNLLRCKLKVKVIINGNGFQYGRALVAYLPHYVWDEASTNSALVREDLVQTSQLPHVFLDPTTSTGGELTLPFFCQTNYLDIPSSQWETMGRLFIRQLNTLKHANGASDVVTISVFAWAEDVKLNVLTSVESSTLTPQSGKEIDEANKKGTISGPATAVAKAAGALTSIPYIAPFAAATQMAASTTAGVAKAFGYCRPPVTKNPEPYRPTANSSLAVTNVPDTAHKLTVDDKQELSIDPRIVGLSGVDPMNIKEIAKRESYLTSFSWPIGRASETILWNSRVSPCLWAERDAETVSFHFPACCMAALPFQFWTGTIRFRFQIVASAFHKGRLKFVYDPKYINSNEYNTNYVSIVDIAEQQDFTIEIANGQEVTLLSHARPGLDSVTTLYGDTRFTSQEDGNGVIGVYVVNELTTPNSLVNNDIEVNVYVSAGDDFEVFVPNDHFKNFVLKPQMGMEGTSTIVPESQNTDELDAPQQSEAHSLGPTSSDDSLVNKVFTGESITSFRTMLKRYSLHTSVGGFAGTGQKILAGRFPLYPFYRGAIAGAVHTASSGPYNFCNALLLHWVTIAHSGWRGSIRYKMVPRGPWDRDNRIDVQRHPITDSIEYGLAFYSQIAYATPSHTAYHSLSYQMPISDAYKNLQGNHGMTLAHSNVNPIVEFEMPYYSPARFVPGKKLNVTNTLFNTMEGFDFNARISDWSNMTAIDFFVAAGEDYQVYFWTGLPRMYYEAAPPNFA